MRAFFGVVAVPKRAQSLRSLYFLSSCMQLSAGVKRHLFVALIVDTRRASGGKRRTQRRRYFPASLVKRDHERRTVRNGSIWIASLLQLRQRMMEFIWAVDVLVRFHQHDGFEAMGTLQFRKLLSHII
jgi:hypothetical protein